MISRMTVRLAAALAASMAILCAPRPVAGEARTVWIDELDITHVSADYGTPQRNRSIGGNALSIGGTRFSRGLGTHANSDFYVALDGEAGEFSATVGVDDEMRGSVASVEFILIGDGKELWKSGVLRAGDAARSFSVRLKGVRSLLLRATDAGDGIGSDHADWCDAKLDVTGRLPLAVNPKAPEAGALTVIAGPYLQNPGETAMTVMWVTNRPAVGWVEYGARPGSLDRRRHGIIGGQVRANTRIHKVRLEGLEPGSTCHYRIMTRETIRYGYARHELGETLVGKTNRFRTLDDNAGTVSFVSINDLHDRKETLAGLIKLADRKPYDLVFLNGDIINDPTTEEQIINFTLGPVGRLFGASVPMLLARGNHETRGAYALNLGDYFDLPGGRYYYSFDHGPVHFIVLDAGEDKEDDHPQIKGMNAFGEFRDEEAAWLRREIESPAFKSAPFRVVVSHIPFYGKTAGEDYTVLEGRKKLAPLLEAGGVDLHICGHTHEAELVPPEPGKHSYPILIGDGSYEGDKGTLSRVEVTKNKLAAVLLDFSGKQIGSLTLPARKP